MCVRSSLHSKGQVSAALNPLQTAGHLSRLEQLPNEILVKIAEELTGGGQEDPSLALQAMRTLVQTSKKMYQTFNALYVTSVFLRALAKQYGQTTEALAARLSTSGAHCFLQNYIHKTGLDEAYALTEQIKNLTFHIFEKAKHMFYGKEVSGLYFQSYEAHNYSHSLISGLQTERGFLMYVDWVFLRVAHPFGVITIYNLEWQKPRYATSIFSIAEVLLHYLEGTFRGISNTYPANNVESSGHLDHPQWIIRRASVSQSPFEIREITLGEMEKVDVWDVTEEIDNQVLAMNVTRPGTICYALRSIFGKVLPQPELKTSNAKSGKLMGIIFSMLNVNQTKSPSIQC